MPQQAIPAPDTQKKAESKPRPVLQDTSREGLTGYLTKEFALYGISGQLPLAIKVIQCESGFNVSAKNDLSAGVAQFRLSTWDWFNSLRGTKKDFNSPFEQLEMMAWAWKNGYQHYWDCWRMLE